MIWKVVQLSEGQLQDVRPEDILNDGLFRKCETYRGGGGYDQFPTIAESRLGYRHHLQFIVQLFGCNLDCPYCYVTREGVWGAWKGQSTDQLVDAFIAAHEAHGLTVFHLMGGAPALQIKQWPELIQALEARCDFDWVFHSDMMLTERAYPVDVLQFLGSSPRVLLAVDIKATNAEEHLRNTRKPLDAGRLWQNLMLVETANVPFYITFTGCADPEEFWTQYAKEFPTNALVRRRESFVIDLIEYDAQPFVDRVPWGGAG